MIKRLLACAVMLSLSAPAFAQKQDTEGWERPAELIHTTAAEQEQAARRVGIHEGTWLVALMIITCETCDAAARMLEGRSGAERTVIVVPAPKPAADQWRRKLGVKKVRVIPVTDAVFQLFGATIMPTFVDMKNGRARRAREDVPQ